MPSGLEVRRGPFHICHPTRLHKKTRLLKVNEGQDYERLEKRFRSLSSATVDWFNQNMSNDSLNVFGKLHRIELNLRQNGVSYRYKKNNKTNWSGWISPNVCAIRDREFMEAIINAILQKKLGEESSYM